MRSMLDVNIEPVPSCNSNYILFDSTIKPLDYLSNEYDFLVRSSSDKKNYVFSYIIKNNNSEKVLKELKIDSPKENLMLAKNIKSDVLKTQRYPSFKQQAPHGLMQTQKGELIEIEKYLIHSQILFNHKASVKLLERPGDFFIKTSDACFILMFKNIDGTILSCFISDTKYSGAKFSLNTLENLLHSRIIKINNEVFYLKRLIYPKDNELACPNLMLNEDGELKLLRCKILPKAYPISSIIIKINMFKEELENLYTHHEYKRSETGERLKEMGINSEKLINLRKALSSSLIKEVTTLCGQRLDEIEINYMNYNQIEALIKVLNDECNILNAILENKNILLPEDQFQKWDQFRKQFKSTIDDLKSLILAEIEMYFTLLLQAMRFSIKYRTQGIGSLPEELLITIVRFTVNDNIISIKEVNMVWTSLLKSAHKPCVNDLNKIIPKQLSNQSFFTTKTGPGGFNINITDENGNTLLHLAFLNKSSTDKIKLILDKKPDVYILNDAGQTPLDIARKMGYDEEVLDMLIQKSSVIQPT